MKYAVYVEGPSEMLFVADMLAKCSDYDSARLGFRCIRMLSYDDYLPLQNPMQGDMNSSDYYQIVSVGGDGKVISKLRRDIPNLADKGFEIIIGLHDVYGDIYKKLNNNERTVNEGLIQDMHESQSAELRKVVDGTSQNAKIQLHFAVMEYETWMLALIRKFVEKKGKDFETILRENGMQNPIQFEKIYHPASVIYKLYEAIGLDYGKHEEDHRSFLASLDKEDFIELYETNKCPSFSSFYECINLKG